MDVDLHGPDIPRMLGITGMFSMGAGQRLLPHRYNDNLSVVSMECLLADRDAAVIWRGPLKHSAIRQFVSEVEWGKLDYLIIDAPPGTGDEPLSVAQTIPEALAVIVTTPQEVALADVRKSINFCRKVNMPVLGLVENMSGLICPHCEGKIALFSHGGGWRTAEMMSVPFLGSLPFDLRVVEGGDRGQPLLEKPDDSPFLKALGDLVGEVESRCRSLAAQAPAATQEAGQSLTAATVGATSQECKVAVPLAGGVLCNHFGHCEEFALIQVSAGQMGQKELVTPPPHEPGLLPRWLGDHGVNVIIAGGMGQRALGLFAERGIQVVTGAPNAEPEALINQYLSGSLKTGPNVCDH
jgi:predicted Fe-Mo cluster-binding NifX family protein/MinD-like ATPase involved in chromosome partitioning or flagellar assembly